MANMGDTLTVKLTDAGRKTGGLIARFKKSSISGATLITLGMGIFQYGGDVLDFIVTNSPAYELDMKRYAVQDSVFRDDIYWLNERNNSMKREISHLDHYIESQNLIARKLLDAGLIDMDTYDIIYHAVEHYERDTL